MSRLAPFNTGAKQHNVGFLEDLSKQYPLITPSCPVIRDRKPERVLRKEHINFLLDDNTHE